METPASKTGSSLAGQVLGGKQVLGAIAAAASIEKRITIGDKDNDMRRAGHRALLFFFEKKQLAV